MGSERFRKLLDSKGKNPLLLFSYGQALMDEGQLEEASGPLLECCEGNKEWLIPRLLLGKACMSLGKTSEAKTWLLEAKRLSVEQGHEEPFEEAEWLLGELAGR